jgi:hypothetical protein
MGLNNQNAAPDADLHQSPLPKAVEVLLEPIARMLVRQGIGGNSAVEIMRRAYVAATINVLKERKQPITAARLKIFTGFPEREVERIRGQLDTAAPVEASTFDQVTKLLTTWHLDDRYSLQFGGTPRELRINGGARDEYTFASLAHECAPNLNADELLKELVALGAVQLSEDTKRARPIARAYLPEPLSLASTERLGRMVRNFTETLDCNFQTEEPENRRVDRHVSADFAISAHAENEFRLMARKEGQALLESLDSWLQQQERAPDNGRRVGVVIFQYVEGAGNEEAPRSEGTVPREDSKSINPHVVGPYFMGSVEDPKKAGSIEPQGDADEGVIDVLNYRGPKK